MPVAACCTAWPPARASCPLRGHRSPGRGCTCDYLLHSLARRPAPPRRPQANSRNCSVPCVTINIMANITVATPLALNGSAILAGQCGAALCTLDGGGASQILSVTGQLTKAKVSALRFANGKNSQGASIYGGATAVSGGAYALFEGCEFLKNDAGQVGGRGGCMRLVQGWWAGGRTS